MMLYICISDDEVDGDVNDDGAADVAETCVRVDVVQPTTSRGRASRRQAATTTASVRRRTGTCRPSAARTAFTPCSRRSEPAIASYPPNVASTKPASEYWQPLLEVAPTTLAQRTRRTST